MTTLTDSFDNNLNFQNNIIVKIGSTYFGKYQPDSGLTIDSDKLILDAATINPTQIDLKRATTQINSTTIRILDGSTKDDYTFSVFMGNDPNALIGVTVQLFFGRVNESIPFSQYLEINQYVISDISKSGSFYTVKAKSQEDKTLTPAFEQQGTLDTSINDTDTSILVDTEEDIFPASGIIRIGNEFISYSATAFSSGITTFTVSARGFLQSTADDHTDGDQTNYVEKVTGNPIELILQLLISSGGGGAYDLLSDGAGIDNTLVDVAGFEAIRDSFFISDVFTLYVSDIEKLVEYIEDELLVPNNVRLIKNSANNLISIAILDQSDPAATVAEIDDAATLVNSPKWKISKRELQTVVKVQWNWSEGLRKFTRSKTFKASTGILALYGEISGKTLSFKGVLAADNGLVIATDRANRFLSRFSTPRAEVKLSSYMSSFQHNVGDKIRVTAKNLPAEGGGVGMSSIIELVRRSVHTSTGVVKMSFRFTSYSNLRQGLISPSPALDLAITSQSVFEVPNGALYKAGFVLRLWDSASNAYYPDAINTIQGVVGNIITMVDPWTTILSANAILFFADYNDVNEEQQSKYAFAVGPTDLFADGSKSYQIIL